MFSLKHHLSSEAFLGEASSFVSQHTVLLDFVSAEKEGWAATAVSPDELILVTHPGLDGLACPSHPPKIWLCPREMASPLGPSSLGDAEVCTG